ncbi:MAG: RNA polymerase sigma factor [Spirosomataceae bacterium]
MLKVKAGDLDKMGLLFERYHRALHAFLYHMTGHADASEDMVQTVFYRMLKYRHTFTADGEFRTWMYHLARNVLNDSFKQNKRHSQAQDLNDWANQLSGGALADETLIKKQELDLLHSAIGKLSPEHREVLILSRFQELKYEEIARILDTTEGAIKVRIHRAMGELRTLFFKIENGGPVYEL